MIKALVNGRVSQTIGVTNRGLNYGDGLFETIKVVDGHPEFFDLHMCRLKADCDRMRIACDLAAVRDDVARIIQDFPRNNHVIKVIVARGESGRGYKPSFRQAADRIVLLDTLPTAATKNEQAGVKVKLCDHRIGINNDLAGIKHLSRLENVVARSEWSNSEIAEGLVMDSSGHIVEGTMSNLFLVRHGELVTPSLQRCGVAGIIRQVILEVIAPQLGLKPRVKDIVLSDLYAAQELFICNSIIGIWPVVNVGCHHKVIGKLTRKIQKMLISKASERV